MGDSLVTPEQQAWLDQFNLSFVRQGGGTMRDAAARFRDRRSQQVPSLQEILDNPGAYGLGPDDVAALIDRTTPQQPPSGLPQPPTGLPQQPSAPQPGAPPYTGLPISQPGDPNSPPIYTGLPVSTPAPNIPPPPLLDPRGPDYTGGGGPRINPTQPGPQMPGMPQPGTANPLASFGYTQGPNGEIIPLMLQQGMNPFQSQNTAGGLLGFRGKADELQMPQLQFNPELQQPTWFTPPTPQAPRDMVHDPWATPPANDAAQPPPQAGGPPRTGPYYQPMGGLLGLPPALAGLLK